MEDVLDTRKIAFVGGVEEGLSKVTLSAIFSVLFPEPHNPHNSSPLPATILPLSLCHSQRLVSVKEIFCVVFFGFCLGFCQTFVFPW